VAPEERRGMRDEDWGEARGFESESDNKPARLTTVKHVEEQAPKVQKPEDQASHKYSNISYRAVAAAWVPYAPQKPETRRQ